MVKTAAATPIGTLQETFSAAPRASALHSGVPPSATAQLLPSTVQPPPSTPPLPSRTAHPSPSTAQLPLATAHLPPSTSPLSPPPAARKTGLANLTYVPRLALRVGGAGEWFKGLSPAIVTLKRYVGGTGLGTERIGFRPRWRRWEREDDENGVLVSPGVKGLMSELAVCPLFVVVLVPNTPVANLRHDAAKDAFEAAQAVRDTHTSRALHVMVICDGLLEEQHLQDWHHMFMARECYTESEGRFAITARLRDGASPGHESWCQPVQRSISLGKGIVWQGGLSFFNSLDAEAVAPTDDLLRGIQLVVCAPSHPYGFEGLNTGSEIAKIVSVIPSRESLSLLIDLASTLELQLASNFSRATAKFLQSWRDSHVSLLVQFGECKMCCTWEYNEHEVAARQWVCSAVQLKAPSSRTASILNPVVFRRETLGAYGRNPFRPPPQVVRDLPVFESIDSALSDANESAENAPWSTDEAFKSAVSLLNRTHKERPGQNMPATDTLETPLYLERPNGLPPIDDLSRPERQLLARRAEKRQATQKRPRAAHLLPYAVDSRDCVGSVVGGERLSQQRQTTDPNMTPAVSHATYSRQSRQSQQSRQVGSPPAFSPSSTMRKHRIARLHTMQGVKKVARKRGTKKLFARPRAERSSLAHTESRRPHHVPGKRTSGTHPYTYSPLIPAMLEGRKRHGDVLAAACRIPQVDLPDLERCPVFFSKTTKPKQWRKLGNVMTEKVCADGLDHAGTHGIEYASDKDDRDALLLSYELDMIVSNQEFGSALHSISEDKVRLEKLNRCCMRLDTLTRAAASSDGPFMSPETDANVDKSGNGSLTRMTSNSVAVSPPHAGADEEENALSRLSICELRARRQQLDKLIAAKMRLEASSKL